MCGAFIGLKEVETGSVFILDCSYTHYHKNMRKLMICFSRSSICYYCEMSREVLRTCASYIVNVERIEEIYHIGQTSTYEKERLMIKNDSEAQSEREIADSSETKL